MMREVPSIAQRRAITLLDGVCLDGLVIVVDG